jgi:hypothetical protein
VSCIAGCFRFFTLTQCLQSGQGLLFRHRRRRSLPRDLENSRNAAVMTAQTVWLPMSSRPVLRQPSRKNPVIGVIEQTSSRSPSTFRGVLGRPPPYRLSSLSIAVSACGVVDRLLIFGEPHLPLPTRAITRLGRGRGPTHSPGGLQRREISDLLSSLPQAW